MRCSRVASGSRSPASCQVRNWSYGRLPLKAPITQSRYGDMSRVDVGLVAVGVGVAREIEPVHRPSARRRPARPASDRRRRAYAPGDASARNASISAGRRRQAGQVEREPPQQHLAATPAATATALRVAGARGRTRRSGVSGAAPRRASAAGTVAATGSDDQCGAIRRRPRPPTARSSAFSAAVSARCDSGGGITSSSSAGRWMRRTSSLLAGSPGLTIAHARRPASLNSAVARVEPQLRLALAGVGTVAAEAAVGQQRPDLAIEVDARGRRLLFSGRGRAGERSDYQHQHAAGAGRHHWGIVKSQKSKGGKLRASTARAVTATIVVPAALAVGPARRGSKCGGAISLRRASVYAPENAAPALADDARRLG